MCQVEPVFQSAVYMQGLSEGAQIDRKAHLLGIHPPTSRTYKMYHSTRIFLLSAEDYAYLKLNSILY